MKPAEYPQRKCREGVVAPNDVMHSCELPALHPGPCASLSSTPLVEARDAWEERNPGWERRIGDHDIIL